MLASTEAKVRVLPTTAAAGAVNATEALRRRPTTAAARAVDGATGAAADAADAKLLRRPTT